MRKIYRSNINFKIISICFLIILIILFEASNNFLFAIVLKLDDNVNNVENVLDKNESILTDEAYLSVHYSDGTMGMILDETYTENEISVASVTYEHLQRTTIISSGRPDNQSIVAVFLGDGFTSIEQEYFLEKVEEIANYMVTMEPFNYYKNYLTVYAVHCISNESGISGERSGRFACHDSSKKPATPQCTPNNGIFNCNHGNDTFFNGYYAWRKSADRVILEMASSDRDKARNIAKAVSSSVNMIQIIANSSMRGGTGQMPTKRQPLGVALTSINAASMYSDWKNVVMHEFGHVFGGLWDEYWNGITPSEYPNMTKENNVNAVKWSSWIGYKNVGVYPFASSEWDGNPKQATNPWYRPHQNCMMRQTSNPFCPVCTQTLLDKMAIATGLQIFDVSNIDKNYIKINKINLNVTGELIIPERIKGRTITIIGNDAFRNCINLQKVIIPNTVTNIDVSAFENCSNLQSITLSSSLGAIGTSAFKGCASLESISIPNSVTHIDTSAFENCSNLQSVTLPSSLGAIGTSAFKGCGSLESITIPSSVQYIDDSAFKNCSSLTLVTIKRKITEITNLGTSVFSGCNTNLRIVVPTNRVPEYKNKENWSNYENKIMPSGTYIEYGINCEESVKNSLTLRKANNELYKLNVNCAKSYKINGDSSENVNIIIYDENMNMIIKGSNTITQFLGCGTYFISFEFEDVNTTERIEIEISLTWKSSNIAINKGVNNIKNSMHLNSENMYHCSYEYFNNQGEGFYRFSLNAGNNGTYPEGSLKIYLNSERVTLLKRYETTEINKQARTQSGENELYVFLPRNGYYYIVVTLPKSTYSLITFTIEQIEQKDINYQNRLDTNTIDELFDNKTNTNYFEEVTISHRSKIELDIVTSGIVNTNIPIYVFEKHRDPGSEVGYDSYYLNLEYADRITSAKRNPIFTIILNPGTYYIGYSDNLDNASISFSLRRKVNTDLNIDGTLVTDPARNQGFPLGSEVTFNNGTLRGNTITEGFTRNIYLMVEDRVNDPMSRLDYDWYSSNENVAIVTKYGTVLALNVNENTTVTIYAINKDDPSIVYKKDFIILKETKTEQIVIECNMSYSYSEENGMYTLELDFTNSPYPYIGYYVWDIECADGINVDMEHHGLVSSTGVGEALLTANYTLNMRIFLKIHLTITE